MKDEYLTSLALQVALILQSFQQECINDEYVTSLTLQAALLVRPFQQECMKDEYLTLLCIYFVDFRPPCPHPPPPTLFYFFLVRFGLTLAVSALYILFYIIVHIRMHILVWSILKQT